jgi:choline transport protein
VHVCVIPRLTAQTRTVLTYSQRNMYFALYNGGPNTFVFSSVIVFFGAIAQAASLAEMASIQPVAGAQYHWTYHLAPNGIKRFATWIQGWSTWFGYVSLLAGIANVTIILLEATIQLNHDDYTPGGWHTSVLVIAMCVLLGAINMFAFKLIPWVELVAGVLHVALFVVFVVVLAVMGTRHNAEFVFLESNTSSGWDDKFVSWNLGMLTCVWSFTSFDSAIHMAEETRQAKSAVPRAMFWSIFMNGILAFVMVIVILVAMGSVEDALNSSSPIVAILLTITGSKPATTAMTSEY